MGQNLYRLFNHLLLLLFLFSILSVS